MSFSSYTLGRMIDIGFSQNLEDIDGGGLRLTASTPVPKIGRGWALHVLA
jgi:hypothetical protein